jgi:hypothetical protein
MKPLPQLIERRDAAHQKKRAWLLLCKQIRVRDKYSCRACGSMKHIDVHHKKLRSAGGEDSTQNCLCLCRYCHALVHSYRLFIHGDSADGTLRFEAVK